MMHDAGPDRLHPVATRTSPGATSRGARGVRPRSWSPRPHYMRPNFFVNTPDILHAYLQYGGPPTFKIRAVLAATVSPTWGVYSGFELFEHVAGAAGQRGVPRLREVPAAAARLGRREAEGRSLAPLPAPASTSSGARTRRCSSCATCTSTTSTTTEPVCFSKRDDEHRRHRPRGRQPRPARHPGGDGRWTCRRSAWTGTTGWSCTTRSAADRTTTGAQFNYVRLDPYVEPAHVFAVRR